MGLGKLAAYQDIKRLADELAVEKGKVVYLEAAVGCITAQRDDANTKLVAAQGRTDRAVECLNETRVAKLELVLDRTALRLALQKVRAEADFGLAKPGT